MGERASHRRICGGPEDYARIFSLQTRNRYCRPDSWGRGTMLYPHREGPDSVRRWRCPCGRRNGGLYSSGGQAWHAQQRRERLGHGVCILVSQVPAYSDVAMLVRDHGCSLATPISLLAAQKTQFPSFIRSLPSTSTVGPRIRESMCELLTFCPPG